MGPRETRVNLETPDHQGCLVLEDSMESEESLACRAFRDRRWVHFTFMMHGTYWSMNSVARRLSAVLSFLFFSSPGTRCIRPAYYWSGIEDVAGWVSRPEYTPPMSIGEIRLAHFPTFISWAISRPSSKVIESEWWCPSLLLQRGWQRWRWAPRGLCLAELVWWVLLVLPGLRGHLDLRGHMVYLVPAAFLAWLEDLDRLETQDLKVDIGSRVSINTATEEYFHDWFICRFFFKDELIYLVYKMSKIIMSWAQASLFH